MLPASWQDTCSGVFAIAAASLALGFGPLAGQTGRRLAVTTTLAGLAAFSQAVGRSVVGAGAGVSGRYMSGSR